MKSATDITLAKSNYITARNRLERADIDEPVLYELAVLEFSDAWEELTRWEILVGLIHQSP